MKKEEKGEERENSFWGKFEFLFFPPLSLFSFSHLSLSVCPSSLLLFLFLFLSPYTEILSLPLTSHFSVTFLSCFSFSPVLPLVSVSLLLTSVSFLSCFSFSSLFLFSPRHPHFFSFSPPLIRVLPLLFLFQPNVLLSC